MPPATVNRPPPCHTITSPFMQDTIEKIVHGIMEKQQQSVPVLKKCRTKKCLSCGQPKSKYERHRSSIHNFYQHGPVRYFYCSKKVLDTYAEGLTNHRMPFKNFVDTEFFQREKRVEDKQKQKRKESPAPERKCRFWKQELRQGPKSPHIHTGFSGYQGNTSTAEVFSLYREQGLEREKSWESFKSLLSMRR